MKNDRINLNNAHIEHQEQLRFFGQMIYKLIVHVTWFHCDKTLKQKAKSLGKELLAFQEPLQKSALGAFHFVRLSPDSTKWQPGQKGFTAIWAKFGFH